MCVCVCICFVCEQKMSVMYVNQRAVKNLFLCGFQPRCHNLGNILTMKLHTFDKAELLKVRSIPPVLHLQLLSGFFFFFVI